MADDVILNKVATIERCIKRIREEYHTDPHTFATHHTRQDAAILNLLRACEAAIDMGQHIIRREKLGIPQSARDVFQVLEQSNIIPTTLANHLKHMVGFRNIAVHDYQAIEISIVVAIIQKHLENFLEYTQLILAREQS